MAALLLLLFWNGNPVFRFEPLRGDLLETVKRTTWHAGCPIPPEDLCVLHVTYWTYQNKKAEGILLVNQALAPELAGIFGELYKHRFPIGRMEPVENFGGDDEKSMAANNTSAFNCRDITGQKGKFSNHSWGRAIDINPLTNPYVKGDRVLPEAGRAYLDRSIPHPGSLNAQSFAVQLFQRHGWTWGGSWPDRQDYQHFEKK